MLADSVLAQIILQKPQFVEKTIHKVSTSIKEYWDVKKLQFSNDNYKQLILSSWKYLFSSTSFGSIESTVADDIFKKYSQLSNAIEREKAIKRKLKRDANNQKLKSDLLKIQGQKTQAQQIVVNKELQKLQGMIDNWFVGMTESPVNIPSAMNLHDHFKRLFERLLGPMEQPLGPRPKPGQDNAWKNSAIYQRLVQTEHIIRPEWYDNRKLRGRVNAKVPPKATSMPGLITQDFTIPVAGSFDRCGIDLMNLKLESHIQGRSRFVTDATQMEQSFRAILAENNIPFSASASGTTSTLFMSAKMFANLNHIEELKEYLLACVAYLVGGGMHTCHEVFWTGSLIKIPYTIGKYIDTLPKRFKRSRDYQRWLAEFWDVARPDRKRACV